MADQVRHPIFARVYERLGSKLEQEGAAEHRDELLAGLEGRAIEVGAGTGLNFRHYPSSVTEVIAVEPEGYVCARAEDAAAGASVPVSVVDGVADRLPVEDGSFDAGVASLVLCSVPDLASALAELHRVIRPGGELRFYEHVLAREPGMARLQRMAGRVWPWFAGGCHPDRDTPAAIDAAGFDTEQCRRFSFRPSIIQVPVAPHVIGVARRP